MEEKELESIVVHIFTSGCALCSLFIVTTVIGFIFYNAYPTFISQGIYFLIGNWDYSAHRYGIEIFLISTLAVTLVTITMAVPIGILTAVFLAELTSTKVASVIRPLIELLVGIPSIVYGIFGYNMLSKYYGNQLQPFISKYIGFIPVFHDPAAFQGLGVFLASTILAIMILPTIVVVSENAIRTVPFEFKEASMALGANHWETIKKVILPTAKSGIITAVVLGIMRAVGETMAVVMLVGGNYKLPNSFFDVCCPATTFLLNDFSEQVGIPEHMSALFALASVLFIIEFALATIARTIGGKHDEV